MTEIDKAIAHLESVSKRRLELQKETTTVRYLVNAATGIEVEHLCASHNSNDMNVWTRDEFWHSGDHQKKVALTAKAILEMPPNTNGHVVENRSAKLKVDSAYKIRTSSHAGSSYSRYGNQAWLSVEWRHGKADWNVRLKLPAMLVAAWDLGEIKSREPVDSEFHYWPGVSEAELRRFRIPYLDINGLAVEYYKNEFASIDPAYNARVVAKIIEKGAEYYD